MKNFIVALSMVVPSALPSKLETDAEQYDLASLLKADYADYNPEPTLLEAGSQLMSEFGLSDPSADKSEEREEAKEEEKTSSDAATTDDASETPKASEDDDQSSNLTAPTWTSYSNSSWSKQPSVINSADAAPQVQSSNYYGPARRTTNYSSSSNSNYYTSSSYQQTSPTYGEMIAREAELQAQVEELKLQYKYLKDDVYLAEDYITYVTEGVKSSNLTYEKEVKDHEVADAELWRQKDLVE